MDFKDIQKKLEKLRDRIRAEGSISTSSELELKKIMSDTLASANTELNAIQSRLSATMTTRAGNDNGCAPAPLSDEQKNRLRLVEKTGTGSDMVH